MTKPTLNSSDSLPIPDSGAMDSLWQPSWLHWLISALSGTVEIEKQTAWLKKHNEELRKSNAEWLKKERMSLEELRKSNAEWLRKEQMSLEKLRRENAKLRELESKLDAVLPKYNSSLTPQTEIEDS
ncbi:hypothetical protein [Synechocystis sp. CACIAM 05]|uniref:hypothetical protein n=1 Tax=Synechocystis sp. CACIAM 05 TaxID=1933929 RepID=UPI00194E42B3